MLEADIASGEVMTLEHDRRSCGEKLKAEGAAAEVINSGHDQDSYEGMLMAGRASGALQNVVGHFITRT